MGIMSQSKEQEKIGLNQSLIYIHPFLLLLPQVFFAPFQHK
jgi:hypothetical protein